ncbi:MAG TPA: Fur family transcriptional regulator [Hyphomicrobiaceae bacterium]|nr:Fur family transcriptional regulator [Hyphomicrobiaceae bacterium]
MADEQPTSDALAARLKTAGLRPTRQRIALGELLLNGPDRHVTAEGLHAEALAAGESVSLATVYNTLHQFVGVGLLRELALNGDKAYFDTNVSNHSHFFDERSGRVTDIDDEAIRVEGVPIPPAGMEISHVDVVVHLRPASSFPRRKTTD